MAKTKLMAKVTSKTCNYRVVAVQGETLATFKVYRMTWNPFTCREVKKQLFTTYKYAEAMQYIADMVLTDTK